MDRVAEPESGDESGTQQGEHGDAEFSPPSKWRFKAKLPSFGRTRAAKEPDDLGDTSTSKHERKDVAKNSVGSDDGPAVASLFRSSLLTVLAVDGALLLLWLAWTRPGPASIGRFAPVVGAAAVLAAMLYSRPLLRTLAFRLVRSNARLFVPACAAGVLAATIATSASIASNVFAHVQTSLPDRVLGPVDVVVAAKSPQDRTLAQERLSQRLQLATDLLGSSLARLIDGQIALVDLETSVAKLESGAPSRTIRAHVVEVDTEQAAAFDPTSFKGRAPLGAGRVLLGANLARYLGARRGDRISVQLGVVSAQLDVDDVLPAKGLAALSLDATAQPFVVFVAPGTLTSQEESLSNLRYVLALSSMGDARVGAERADATAEALDRLYEGSTSMTSLDEPDAGGEPRIDVSVRPLKSELLRNAARVTNPLHRLLVAIGSLLTIGALALLVQLALGIARSLRREFASLRAVGLQRLDVLGVVGAYGFAVAIVSAFGGALFGAILARLALRGGGAGSAARAFAANVPTFSGVSTYRPMVIGLSLSFCAVLLVMVLAGLFEIAGEVRSGWNPREPLSTRRLRRIAFAVVPMAGFGVFHLIRGIRAPSSLSLLSGVCLLVFTFSAVSAWKWPHRRILFNGAAVLSLIGAVLPFAWPSRFRHSEASTFVLQLAVLAIGPAILVGLGLPTTPNGRIGALSAAVGRVVGRVSIAGRKVFSKGTARRKRGVDAGSIDDGLIDDGLVVPEVSVTSDGTVLDAPAGHLAIARRLAAAHGASDRSRSLMRTVVASLVFASLFSTALLSSTLRKDVTARRSEAQRGWSHLVIPAFALETPSLVQSLRVSASADSPAAVNAASLATAVVTVSADDGAATSRVAIVTDDVRSVAGPTLVERAKGLATDAAVYAALANDGVIVDRRVLADGGVRRRELRAGEQVSIADPASGRSRLLTIVGIARFSDALEPVMIGPAVADSIFPVRPTADRVLVRSATANRLPEASLASLLRGRAELLSVRSVVDARVRAERQVGSFLRRLLILATLVAFASIAFQHARAIRERASSWRALRMLGAPLAIGAKASSLDARRTVGLGVGVGTVASLIACARFVWGGAFGVGAPMSLAPLSWLLLTGVLMFALRFATRWAFGIRRGGTEGGAPNVGFGNDDLLRVAASVKKRLKKDTDEVGAF